MLERTDRLALAVPEAAPALETFRLLFDCEVAGTPQTPLPERERVGLNDKIWQITYAVPSLDDAVATYTERFDLGGRFTNRYVHEGYGYLGAITWVDARDGGLLDSLEYLEPSDPAKAVARFVARAGAGIYMASIESDDVGEIRRRVASTGPGWDGAMEGGGFIHPRRLHGLLLGLTTFASWNARRPLPPGGTG